MSLNKLKKALKIESDIESAVFELSEKLDQIEIPERGEKGDKGDKGETGATGATGRPGMNGKDGRDGLDGKDGLDGLDGLVGPQGERGEKGIQGEVGPIPDHEWKGTSLRFQKPDKTWGKWVDLKGEQGYGSFWRGGGMTREAVLDLINSSAGTAMQRDNLTSQCDGENIVFTLSYDYKPGTIQLWSSQFPIVFDPDTDFTETTSNTITLVGIVPEAGQTLVCLYQKL